MVVFALRVMPDFENCGAEAASAPTDCTKLFRIVILLVNQIRLVENLLRFLETNAVLLFDASTLIAIKLEVIPSLQDKFVLLCCSAPATGGC
jgi:hypothetical protein